MSLAGTSDSGVSSEAKRNALVLMVAQAINGSLSAITITLGGLAGIYLLGLDKQLATLPVTIFSVGVAVGALPAAYLMRRIGRQRGFMAGSLIAALGGVAAALAIFAGNFALFSASTSLIGFGGAFVQQYRFAAADAADPGFKAKAISWVMAGGVASAIIGPQTVIFTRNLLAPTPFAGGFLGAAALGVVGFLVLMGLVGEARDVPKPAEATARGRGLREIAAQPRFVVAVLCGVGSFGLMSLVMTAAPLAMVACGLEQDQAALGIQWHILAMFGPSFVTGHLIARFGKEMVTAAGLVLLAACAVVALNGVDLIHFWVALILLGVGWNFGFLGATAMLTDCYQPQERSRAQGLNDFLVFGCVALASFSSGKLLNGVGWDVINWIVFPVTAICGLALLFAFTRRVSSQPRPA